MFKKIVLIVLLLFALQTTYAAVDMFLKIEGIDGESKDSEHTKDIDVLAWSFSAKNAKKNRSLSCGQELIVTKRIDSASENLLNDLSRARVYPRIELQLIETYRNSQGYYLIELEDAYITSYTTGVASGDDRPTEEVAFYYNKITYTYQKQKPDGSKDKQSFKFDMKKCKS